ncbi:DUF3558 family protein [Pseudonocardia sp. KRD291]|uniref:DUF3558 family protein n=1 Tax=Pseudonocardia sp. KRD291 TaxID=2792007 RepID=UPI001C4A3778|nr:DUF3558 family protein [Pseudonocardia sp. KRD291]MBW0101947.1 DUF3558 domain-containing protein [Pseudonocardia sp. KRD291]
MSRPIWLESTALAAVAAALLSGCAAGPTDTAAPTSTLPPRPAELDVLAIDPCSMLDRDQQARFAIVRGFPTRNTVNGATTNGCGWRAEDRWNYIAQTFPIGAETALTDPTAVPTTVAGYGAVQTWVATPGSATPPICLETIDTTSGAAVRVHASLGPGERADPDAERPAVCARAQELAEAVMTTIRR